MTHDEYKIHIAKYLNEMAEVTASKNHDYSVRDDAMDNFKLIGEMLGISPRLVWSVLWMKHVTAVINHMAKDKSLRSETIHGRFIDLANYSMLGDALDKDLASSPEDRVVMCPIVPHWIDNLDQTVELLKKANWPNAQSYYVPLGLMAKRMKEFLDAVNGSEDPTSPLHGDPAGVQRGDQVGRSDRKPEPGPDPKSNPTRLSSGTAHA
jgi:hypothetical protein